MPRRAKIAATLGPACDADDVVRELLRAGVDVVRLNFSHGTAAEHRRRVRRLRRLGREEGHAVAVLADLQGPRFRVGELPGGCLELVQGRSVDIVAGGRAAGGTAIPVSYSALARDVEPGQPVLIDDGTIALRVERVRGDRVRCRIERGGELRDHKGINLPESRLSVPVLTRKDRQDLRTALAIGADWLAISFVRRGRDLDQARREVERAGGSLPLMAKIERAEAVERLDEIIESADGLLVARGDLGVELPPERVPLIQKRIIDQGRRAGKPVMTATQMLDSMRHSPRPTRAEASDVANAVLDGSGCLLLTAETAVGEYPVESVTMMARIIEQAETAERSWSPPEPEERLTIPQTTCLAGCRAAARLDARALVVFTSSGFSAHQTARFRPPTPILAFTPSEGVVRELAMLRGVRAYRMSRKRTIEEVMDALDRELLERALCRRDEVVVVLSGSPIGVSGTTNLMKVHRVGSALRRRRR